MTRNRNDASDGSNVDDTHEASDSAKRKEIDACRTERRIEGSRLQSILAETTTVPRPDRPILARNFGRLIERSFKGRERSVAAEVFHAAYPQGGVALAKKRKRTIRFSGEPPEGDDIYTAHGKTYSELLKAFIRLRFGNAPTRDEETALIIELCEGTSFVSGKGPRLDLGRDAYKSFSNLMAQLLDKIACETDIVGYLSEIRGRRLVLCPSARKDFTPEEWASLHIREPEVRAITPLDDSEPALSRTILRIPVEELGLEHAGSNIFPTVTIARVYMPRPILCFDGKVSKTALQEIRDAEPIGKIIAAARQLYIDDYGGLPRLNFAAIPRNPDEIDRLVLEHWKAHQELRLFEDAVRQSGFDPDALDWEDLEDPEDQTAAEGTHWRCFWQAQSVKLVVTAQGEPEALKFGLRVDVHHWNALWPKALCRPKDDDISGSELDCDVSYWRGEFGSSISWFPDYIHREYENLHPCRGLLMYLGPEEEAIEFAPDFDPRVEGLISGYQDVSEKAAWDFLTLRMDPWQQAELSLRPTERPAQALPAIRLLFSAPAGMTPAPDDTLASAIFRSLAFGEGSERLDAKLIKSVNDRVARLKELNAAAHEAVRSGLRRNGYKS